MHRNMVETVLGAVVLVVAAGFLFFAYRTTDLRAVEGYEISARFAQVEGLERGSDVKISGVKVGTVLDYTLDPHSYRAVVRMSIDPKVRLPIDTAAVIRSEGLLDGKFMALEPGGDEEFIEPGGKIDYTTAAPSLETLLGKVMFSLGGAKEGRGSAAESSADTPAPEPAAGGESTTN